MLTFRHPFHLTQMIMATNSIRLSNIKIPLLDIVEHSKEDILENLDQSRMEGDADQYP